MKRLIKRSEIYDGFNRDGKYLESFKNPTAKEIEEVKKISTYNSVRGVIYDDGTVIIWPGEILHNSIKNCIKNVDIDQFRFAWEPNKWIIDAHGRWTLSETEDLILKYESILSQYGDVTAEFNLFFAKKLNPTDRTRKDTTIEKIKELKMQTQNQDQTQTQTEVNNNEVNTEVNDYSYQYAKNSRLLKKYSEIYDGFGHEENYVEVFKNPTAKEIEDTGKNGFQGSIRGVISDNTMFIWPGNIVHANINEHIQQKIDIDQFRFAYEPGDRWIIDAHEEYNFDEITDLIIKYENELSKIGDTKNTKFDIYFYTGPEDNDIVSLDDIKGYKKDHNYFIKNKDHAYASKLKKR